MPNLKNIRTTFRKLYQNPVEGEMINAIIAYSEVPYLTKKYPEDYQFEFTCTNFVDFYVAQYRKRLRIDLWLVVIDYDWLTKEITL